MSNRKLRPYTDEELGHVGATMHLSMSEVGEQLGRPAGAIDKMRRRVRSGWVRERDPWSPEEVAVISSPHLTIRQMAERLPGRSEATIKTRRSLIGISAGNYAGTDLNPMEVRGRPLLAKTCRECGLLLPAGWYGFDERSGKKKWRSYCRKCAGGLATASAREPGYKGSRAYEERAQAITSPLAVNMGSEYTEKDHAVLSDPSLTNLAKALILKRTYRAVSSQCSLNGYKSHVWLGAPERDQWMIDNPNSDRVDEITASLHVPGTVTPTRPDFEWDD